MKKSKQQRIYMYIYIYIRTVYNKTKINYGQNLIQLFQSVATQNILILNYCPTPTYILSARNVFA